MYFLYTLALFGAVLLYAPFFLARARLVKREPVHARERLGLGLEDSGPGGPTVWIHAVSVGEVLSLQHLVREVKARHPGWRVVFSTLTAGGLRVAREKLPGVDRVFLLPLDFPGPLRRVVRAFRPSCLVLAESEFWPNLLRIASGSTRGVLVVNGRISQRTHQKYAELKPLARRILRDVARFLVQTPVDRSRLLDIGVPAEKVEVAGNLKCEIDLPALGPAEVAALRADLGIPARARVFVAGSTRKGEEEKILRAFAEARSGRAGLRLVVAPRHVERAPEAERIARSLGLRTALRTSLRAAGGSAGEADAWDVLVLDTLGELARTYALCDGAFIGGSLVDWGGHNLLEPAFYAKPVYFGPHMQNFAALAESFLREGAARTVRSAQDLREMFLAAGEAGPAEMGRKARAHLESLSGATEKALRAIEGLMGNSTS